MIKKCIKTLLNQPLKTPSFKALAIAHCQVSSIFTTLSHVSVDFSAENYRTVKIKTDS